MDLNGKIAVVTGAGGGLGSRMVRLLKKRGVKCVLIEKDKSLLESIKDILDGDESQLYECDMTDLSEVEKTSKAIAKKFERVDILLNVAGIGIYKNIEDLTVDDWTNSININLNAPFIFTKFLIGSLKNSGHGVVVNIGSGMGVLPTPGRSAYCASKFGLRGLSLTLSREFKEKGVSFSLMTLGSMMTGFGTGGMEERKRLEAEGKKYLDPDEVAGKIIEVIEDENRKEEYEIYPEGYGV